MKSLSLLIFAAVFVLSSAVPRNKGNDEYRSLARSNEENHKSLQAKPPGGPKLAPEDLNPVAFLESLANEEKPKKRLSSLERRNHAELKKATTPVLEEGNRWDRYREGQETQQEKAAFH